MSLREGEGPAGVLTLPAEVRPKGHTGPGQAQSRSWSRSDQPCLRSYTCQQRLTETFWFSHLGRDKLGPSPGLSLSVSWSCGLMSLREDEALRACAGV